MSIHAHWGAEGRVVGDAFHNAANASKEEDESAAKMRFEVMGYLEGKVPLAASAAGLLARRCRAIHL